MMDDNQTAGTSATARDCYLATQVMTATPQKLQLLLIDGAIRCGQRAKRMWQDGQDEAAGEALVRCQEIVGDLLASVASSTSDLARRMAAIYLYLFRTLTQAHLNHDPQKLDDALSVLEIEQETWREVCQKFGSMIHQGPHIADRKHGHAPSSSAISDPGAEQSGISFQA